MKKKYISIFILIIILIFLFVTFIPKEETGTIKVGVITALTGDLANYGKGTLNAAQLAVDEINFVGGINGRKIELVAEDSPCDPTTATTVVNKLINFDQVDVFLGPLCSSELLAIAPILNNEKIVVISSSTTSSEITSAGDYVFRNVASDDLRSKVFVEYIYSEKGITDIAIIYENDDAGVGFKDGFVEVYERLGGNVLIIESYEKDSNDMRTQLTKIKNKKPESILMISYPSETGTILKQAKELDIEAQFFEGFEIMMDPQVAEIAGDAVNGVIYIQTVAPESIKNNEFKNKYQEEYGEEAPYYSVEAYDIIKLYEIAMKDGIDSEKIKNNLYAIENFEGASGMITFDEKGDCIKPFEIGEVQNRELVTIKII